MMVLLMRHSLGTRPAGGVAVDAVVAVDVDAVDVAGVVDVAAVPSLLVVLEGAPAAGLPAAALFR